MPLPDVSSLLPTDQQHQNSMQELEMVVPRAMQIVAGMGFTQTPHPGEGFFGDLPPNINDLPSDQLGYYLSRMKAFSDYSDQQMAIAEAQRDVAEIGMKRVKAFVRLRVGLRNSEGKKHTVDDKSDYMTIDPRVDAAEKNYLVTLTVWRLCKVMVNKADLGWQTVSRIMSTRLAEMERGRIEHARAGAIVSTPTTFQRAGAPRRPNQ